MILHRIEKRYFIGNIRIVGMLEPTSGVVRVEGFDHRIQIQDVRRILGFCPQYGKKNIETIRATADIFLLDILYNELSVEEHLDLMGQVCKMNDFFPIHFEKKKNTQS